MINRDSNNSIIRTNIFSKSIGGKKKNKTIKKRKGGFSFFSEKPCKMEEENLNNKRKMLKKDGLIALKNYKDEFKKLLNNLKEDARIKCQEYTKAQKELLYQHEARKPKSYSIFDTKLKYKGGYLTKTMKNKLKKEINNQEQIFNSHLYNIVKNLYQSGGDSDYCASIIKEYQEKVIELKKNFEVLLSEYATKNYNEPLQHARSLYNQCVLRHNEGEVEVPVPPKPSVPVHKVSDTIDSESKKLFASMVSGPEYVNGKLQKPVIIAPNLGQEKKDDQASMIDVVKKVKQQHDELTGLFGNQNQKKGDNQNQFDKVKIEGKTYTKNELENKNKSEREKLLEAFNKEYGSYFGKKDDQLNDDQKNAKQFSKQIKAILGKN